MTTEARRWQTLEEALAAGRRVGAKDKTGAKGKTSPHQP